jgi:hypothetical protein
MPVLQSNLAANRTVAPREGFEPSRPNGSQAFRSRRSSRLMLPLVESAPYQISRNMVALGDLGTTNRIAINLFFSLFEKAFVTGCCATS